MYLFQFTTTLKLDNNINKALNVYIYRYYYLSIKLNTNNILIYSFGDFIM